MPENNKPSLVLRLIQGAGGVLAVGAPLLGIPVLGPVGAVLEKMPVADLEEWVGRMRRRLPNSEATAIAPPALPPPVFPLATRETKSKPDAPVAQRLSEAEILRQVKDLVLSEPFAFAMTQAIGRLPRTLGDFIAATYPTAESRGAGVWPTFSLEWIARRHFQSELGRSAAAAELSEVRELVERGLALDAIEILVDQARNSGPGGVRLDDSVRVFSSDIHFAWPGRGDFSPGYVVAYVSPPTSVRSMKTSIASRRSRLATNYWPNLGVVGRLRSPISQTPGCGRARRRRS